MDPATIVLSAFLIVIVAMILAVPVLMLLTTVGLVKKTYRFAFHRKPARK